MPAMPTPPARVDIVREFPDTTWADDGPTRGVERIVEDGIRDRSPSRGLGDVYKRQVRRRFVMPIAFISQAEPGSGRGIDGR